MILWRLEGEQKNIHELATYAACAREQNYAMHCLVECYIYLCAEIRILVRSRAYRGYSAHV